jgi:hypothetical protein
MADNVQLPVTGTGTADIVQATDDVTSVHYPIVKLADGTLGNTTAIAAGGGVEAGALRVTLASDSTGVVSVDDNGGALTVDGTVAVSSLPALAAGTNNIGDVDVLTVPAPLSTTGGGTEATALRVTIANDSTGVVSIDDNAGSLTVDNAGTFAVQSGGNVAHDAADSGNPVKVGGRAISSLAGATLVAAADRTDFLTGLDGVQLVRPYASNADIKSQRVADTAGTSTAFTAFGAVASTYNYLTTLTIYNSSATAGYVDIRDGAAGSVLFTAPAPAAGGSVISFPVPLRSTVNTALAYDVSGAISTVYISAVGFQSKV